MKLKTGNLWLPMIILAVALPAVTAFLYYQATKNPNLRPLGITKEELSFNNTDGGTGAINVLLEWGVDSTLKMSPAEVQAVLARSLGVFNADFWFTVTDVPGDKVRVSYRVGGNVFGPYRVHRTAGGIHSAVYAQRLFRKQNGEAEPDG